MRVLVTGSGRRNGLVHLLSLSPASLSHLSDPHLVSLAVVPLWDG